MLTLHSGQGGVMLAAAVGAMCSVAAVLAGPRLLRRLRGLWHRLRAIGARNTPHFETLPVPLMRFAADGTVLAANSAARRLVGKTATGRMAHEMFEDLGRPIADWLRGIASGQLPGGSEVLRLRQAPDGGDFVQMTVQRSGDDHLIAVLQDATALKRLEAQFTQSQKMQAIGQLAGGIAHDFNNLLTAITGHCDLLLLRHGAYDPDHEDLQQIQQNAYRAGALVRQLLAFSRKQTLVPERIDLAEVLGQMAHLLKRSLSTAVTLDLRHAPVPVFLRLDKGQFEQVILNLAVNARDAMPMGGVLRIESELATVDDGFVRDAARVPRGRYGVIRVRDSGSGIEPEVLGKIFEPFFTTKRVGEGTGLGLSTVYGIVKQSGGYVFVDSALGEGTEFQLWFPAAEEEPLRHVPATAPPRRALPQSEGVVLLVEDEAPVRAFAARALRLRGLTVLEAETGEQALDLLAKPLRVDLLVSDVILPGLDGPEWVRRALQDRPGMPVIFMSGYAADSPAEAQGRIENSVFLPKPFSLAELSETVTRHMPQSAAKPVIGKTQGPPVEASERASVS